jgi:hypothetical protein
MILLRSKKEITDLNSGVCAWYIDDNSIIDEIINYHKKLPLLSDEENAEDGETYKYKGVLYGNRTDDNIKTSIDCAFPHTTKFDFSEKYVNALQDMVTAYVEKYQVLNYIPQKWALCENPIIQYYPPEVGGFPVWHYERTSDPLNAFNFSNYRILVFMTYLNDVEEGGETEFLHQNLKIKPEKGLTLIWPADWFFTHKGNLTKKKEKWIVTGWFGIDSQKYSNISSD